MSGTVAEKIINGHIVEGTKAREEEVALKIDQTLTQDATGTMACLQFEAIGIPRARAELSVSYVDHNTLQTDFKNADDHRYLQSIARKYGLEFSRPGNGICHQLHLERFACPGKTLIGSDSHTPTAGGIGAFAIGAGGLDVAVAMAGMPYRIKYPDIVGIKLAGKLPNWVSAKDVILEVLRRIDVKGGVGKVLEYFGPGVKTLSVPERATITNMGTETGATTSVFPSDQETKAFMEAQERGEQWVSLEADADAEYDEIIELNLSEVEPLAALPHSPGKVKPVSEIAGIEVQQVAIGSCTNSSLRDLKIAANILNGHTIADGLHLTINPGSRQVVEHLIESGEMRYLIAAGARILENTCGPCIGMGAAPPSQAISVRTFNRNFEGRSGTKDADVFLTSPEVAAATAIKGVLTDPRDLGDYPKIEMPLRFIINDNMFIRPLPPDESARVMITRGPNIKPLPDFMPLPDTLEGEVLLKVGDNITTDHIMPAGARILPLRSNIPEISKYVFEAIDPLFPSRALESGGGFIIGGENYGQGSSREHAALAPKYLGVKAVIVKSFARIHLANLINFGIVPLTFKDPADYDSMDMGDKLEVIIGDLRDDVRLRNRTKDTVMELTHSLSQLDAEILKTGGKLPWVKVKVRVGK
ncbi:MAG TPA: aconitate hydratase [Ectothiorhodospiraceae bacterium]|nr:MAG: aconitate hydratase [Methanosarcinales archaeon]HEA26425.1 aconitate hydratase [Ectothiorhodospiraceae bacterium]